MPEESFPLAWIIDPSSAQGEKAYSFTASSSELAALRDYAGVDSVEAFAAAATVLAMSRGRFKVRGTYDAKYTQQSVITLEILPVANSEVFEAEYWPEDAIETLGADSDLEVEALQNGKIPVGALLSQLFSVSVDPYPKGEGEAYEPLPSASADALNPFAKLATLRPTPKNGSSSAD